MTASLVTATHGSDAHGPVASAIKWAFKGYVRARRAIDEVVAEARAEHQAARATLPDPVPAPVAGGSDAGDGRPWRSARGEPIAAAVRPTRHQMAVRWLTAAGAEEHAIQELPALLRRDDGFAWVDIPTFDAAAEQMLAETFGFHPLALRDCREPGHVPKVHAYDDHLFVVLHAPERDADGQIQHRELNQFLGPRYLVTVHERVGTGPLTSGRLETDAVLDRIEQGRANPATPAELSYAIVTRLSVRMEAMVSELARTVDAVEAAVSSHERHLLRRSTRTSATIADEMFALPHAPPAIETIADQNRVVYARTSTLAARLLPRDQRRFIDDVEDQFNRVRRLCRSQKELLQGVLDFSRTRTSAKMDLAMSRLALLSAIALPISIISSIYGMNLFVFSQTRLDVLAVVLGMMAVLTYGMLRWSRLQGWW
jgi:Mg2+ and Co2+ transporter CorA